MEIRGVKNIPYGNKGDSGTVHMAINEPIDGVNESGTVHVEIRGSQAHQ